MAKSNYNWSFGDTKGFKKDRDADNFAPNRQYRSAQGLKEKCKDGVIQRLTRKTTRGRGDACVRPHIFDDGKSYRIK